MTDLEEQQSIEAPMPKEVSLPEEPMEPMKVELSDDNVDANTWEHWMDWMYVGKDRGLPRKYQLVTDENARQYSIYAVQFAIMASAVNTKLLNPNFAIMATPGLHDDSFPNTDPFDFNSATYFIPMCTLLGVAIASIFLGGLSDRMGRKPVILILAIISTIGSVVKFFCSGTFWGFCIANFAFGFFLGNLPVGMAYIGDIYSNKEEKEAALGVLVGCFVMGNSGGGVIAILMENTGLFTPLLVGAAIMAISCVATSWYMIEPGDERMAETTMEIDLDDDDEDNSNKRPTEINQPVMWNVVAGALLDNIGSTGLFPLCLSPLAYEHYYFNFYDAGDEPIMSLTGYKWLSVCVALMVIPSTMMTPTIFAKIGIAATCVLGNVMTACVTMALLGIGNAPPTQGWFIGFVAVMYGGFPFTVFSQLTTGPMLDVLAPEDKIGYVQGLNNMAMNFGMAFAPWLLGLLADATSTNTAIWTGIGISLGAALANSPLMFRKEMGRPIPKIPAYKKIMAGEDQDVAQRVLDGEFVAPELLFELNRQRALARRPVLLPKVKSYEEDQASMDQLAQHAGDYFRFRRDVGDRALQKLANDKDGSQTDEICELLNLAYGRVADTDEQEEAKNDLGRWIGDYLEDNGYNPHVNPMLIKQMILTAFPVITKEREITPDNLKLHLLNNRRVMNNYVGVRDRQRTRYSLGGILTTQPNQGIWV